MVEVIDTQEIAVEVFRVLAMNGVTHGSVEQVFEKVREFMSCMPIQSPEIKNSKLSDPGGP